MKLKKVDSEDVFRLRTTYPGLLGQRGKSAPCLLPPLGEVLYIRCHHFLWSALPLINSLFLAIRNNPETHQPRTNQG